MDWGILLMGPVGAGKTQAIRTISDPEVVSPLDRLAHASGHSHERHGVAMDMGLLRLSDTDRLHLYAVPGLDRYQAMGDILMERSKGVVLLIHHGDIQRLNHLDRYLGILQHRLAGRPVPLVIGVTHVERDPHTSIDIYNRHLRERQFLSCGAVPAVLAVDARNADHVRCLLLAMTAQLEMLSRFPRLSPLIRAA